MSRDQITAFDLEAYVDDQLDLRRKMAVEEHLARHPEIAVRVMADMRSRNALRILAQTDQPAPHQMQKAFAGLHQRVRHTQSGRLWRMLRVSGTAVAASAIIALLLILPRGPATASSPSFIDEALMARQTSLIRAAMASQPESLIYDTEEIARTIRIRLPVLPADWKITDVQIYPSDDGPALQLMIRTSSSQDISVFAVKDQSRSSTEPTLIRSGEASVAYWRRAGIAYAVTGAAAPEVLAFAARDLADNRLN